MWTSAYYNHWDYWKLYHKVTFDGINKLILVNDGVTSLDVQIDIYSSWKEWILLDDYINAKYEQALTTVGGEPTIENQKLDVTYFLINGWKIKPYPGSYTLNIVGNLFDVDGGEIKVSADTSFAGGLVVPNNITINTNTSVIVRQVTPEVYFSDTDRGTLSDVSASVVDIQSTLDSQGLQIDDISGSVNSNNNLLLDISSSNSSEFNSISASNSYQEQILQELSASAAANGALLIDISGSLVEIKSIFSQPVTASLVSDQEQALFDIQDKLTEIWKIHGLDVSSPLNVTRTSRTADDISQTISTIGSGSTQETTITRT